MPQPYVFLCDPNGAHVRRDAVALLPPILLRLRVLFSDTLPPTAF